MTPWDLILLSVTAPLLWMAWRNWQSARIDRRGMVVLAGVLLIGVLPQQAVVLVPALLLGLTCVFYVAIEPYARRYWPDSLISWSRVTHGHIRNPLVASHVLAGVLAAMLFAHLAWPVLMLPLEDVPRHPGVQAGLSGSIGGLVRAQGFATQVHFVLLVLTFVILLRLAVRRLWVADVLAVCVLNISLSLLWAPTAGEILYFAAVLLPLNLTWIWLMRRFGFLTALTHGLVNTQVVFLPLAPGWILERTLSLHLIPVALAGWALWVVLTTQPRTRAPMADGPASALMR